jgi:thiamine pyrophosphokinase
VKDFIIFVHGVYKTEHLSFYRKLCRSRIKIAVDGGLKFFLKAKTVPDLLMGDLDSLRRIPKDLPGRTRVITFPSRKDKTDLQLALEYCLNEKAGSLDIVVPTLGGPDHFLGNVMLVNLLDRLKNARTHPKIRFINIRYEIVFMQDRSETFVNCRRDIVSIIPLSSRIVLTCRGTEYDVQNVAIRLGDTRSLRNRILSSKATFNVKGKAFVIRQADARL